MLIIFFAKAQLSDTVQNKYEYAIVNRRFSSVKVYYENNKISENLKKKLFLIPDADNDSIISSDSFKIIHYMESQGFELFLFTQYQVHTQYLFRRKLLQKRID